MEGVVLHVRDILFRKIIKVIDSQRSGNMSQGALKQFYLSTPWIQLRSNLIIERKATCERCKKVFSDTSKLIGHHKIELTEKNVTDVTISLNKEKIEIICHDCHNKEHRRFGYNTHKVYLVYGAPLSGKQTFVNQLSRYGDLILNIDKIYESISGQELYTKPNNLRFNVFAIRDKIVDMVKTRYGAWCDAYIIGGYPNKHERQKLANDLGAELIFCDVSKEECLRRLELDDKRKHIKSEYITYIDKWFEDFMP